MKGIVASIKGKYAVVLTQNGLFKRIKALPGMSVGMETELEQATNGAVSRRKVMKIASIAAAGLLVLGVGFGAYSYTVPYSYIDLDINPSIGLTVNMYDRIIEAEALNDDGEKLLLDKELKHKKLDYGVADLLDSAVQQGYLIVWSEGIDTSAIPSAQENQSTSDSSQPSDGGTQSLIEQNPLDQASIAGPDVGDQSDDGAVSDETTVIENAVMFTVSSSDTKKSNELKKKIENTASMKLEEDNVNSEVLVGEASVEQRDAARELGVTPGKLALIEDALKHTPEKKPDDIKNTAVKDLIEIARNNSKKDQPKKGIPQKKSDNNKASGSEKGVDSANSRESGNTSISNKNSNKNSSSNKNNNNKNDEGNKKEKGNVGNVVKEQSRKTDNSQHTGNNSNNSNNSNSNDKHQRDKMKGPNVKDVLEKSSEALKKEREILKDDFLSQIKDNKNDKPGKNDKPDKNDKNDKNDKTDKNTKTDRTAD